MNHPESELLLRFAEGEDVPVAVADHVTECDQCTAALGEIARFETRLANASTLPEAERAVLRATTARLLTTASVRRRPGPWRHRVAAFVLAAAAIVVATLLAWPKAGGLGAIDVRRYDPANVVRAERLERFSIDVRLDATRWLALWQLEGRSPRRLMPHADPLLRWLGAEMPLPPGPHRVPAADILDFEFAATNVPTGLVLVAFTAEPAEGALLAIEQTITETPAEGLAAALQAKWPEARVLPFPGR